MELVQESDVFVKSNEMEMISYLIKQYDGQSLNMLYDYKNEVIHDVIQKNICKEDFFNKKH